MMGGTALSNLVPKWIANSGLITALFGQGTLRAIATTVIALVLLLLWLLSAIGDLLALPATLAALGTWADSMISLLPSWAWVQLILAFVVLIYGEFLYKEIRALKEGVALRGLVKQLDGLRETIEASNSDMRLKNAVGSLEDRFSRVDEIYEYLVANEVLPHIQEAIENISRIKPTDDAESVDNVIVAVRHNVPHWFAEVAIFQASLEHELRINNIDPMSREARIRTDIRAKVLSAHLRKMERRIRSKAKLVRM